MQDERFSLIRTVKYKHFSRQEQLQLIIMIDIIQYKIFIAMEASQNDLHLDPDGSLYVPSSLCTSLYGVLWRNSVTHTVQVTGAHLKPTKRKQVSVHETFTHTFTQRLIRSITFSMRFTLSEITQIIYKKPKGMIETCLAVS